MVRENLRFPSGDAECAAWLYRPAQTGERGVPCVVMAHGFSMTRHDGLAHYAEAFAGAGAAVLVFDHRSVGDSSGVRGRRYRAKEHQEDFRNAIAQARRLPGIDPDAVLLWGYSTSGGTAVQVAASDSRIAGLILLSPFLDGLQRILTSARRRIRRVRTSLRARPPGPSRGSGDRRRGPRRSPAANSSRRWQREQARAGRPCDELYPRILAIAFHRPITKLSRLSCPVWVALCERETVVPNKPIERFAVRAPYAEFHRYNIHHVEPFADPHAHRIATDQASWLRHRLIDLEGENSEPVVSSRRSPVRVSRSGMT